MNGIDWILNVVDELSRARDLLLELSESDEVLDLVNDIRADLERYYDYGDSIDEVLSEIKMD